jgi:hypothetical protein
MPRPYRPSGKTREVHTEYEVRHAAPQQHPDVVSRWVDEEAVLVHLKTNRIYSLNPTGARLWELIGAGNDREAAEAALIEEFDVEEGDLRKEVADMLEALAKEGLIL